MSEVGGVCATTSHNNIFLLDLERIAGFCWQMVYVDGFPDYSLPTEIAQELLVLGVNQTLATVELVGHFFMDISEFIVTQTAKNSSESSLYCNGSATCFCQM